MTAHHPFEMPFVMSAEAAAARIVQAVKSGRKVCDFPWQVGLATKLSRWVPDFLMRRVMDGYTAPAGDAGRPAALPQAVD